MRSEVGPSETVTVSRKVTSYQMTVCHMARVFHLLSPHFPVCLHC